MTFTFKLKSVARKSGGDRYTCIEPKNTNWDIYFPQKISRPLKGITLEKINIEVTVPKEN